MAKKYKNNEMNPENYRKMKKERANKKKLKKKKK